MNRQQNRQPTPGRNRRGRPRPLLEFWILTSAVWNVILLVGTMGAAQTAPPPRGFAVGELAPRDGDRIALLGGTFVERAQAEDYLETLLTARYPQRKVVYRNLGWSGDNVWGDSRSGFGSRAEGFRQLVEQVKAVRPNVLWIFYGGNEAFEGSEGLAAFEQGLKDLLHAVGVTQARVVLWSPPPLEKHALPLPDPAAQNQRLLLYSTTLEKVAKQRGLSYVNLFPLVDKAKRTRAFTDNSQHYSPYGYWRVAGIMVQTLDANPCAWQVELAADSCTVTEAMGAKVEMVTRPDNSPVSLAFVVHDEKLPAPLAPHSSTRNSPAEVLPGFDRILRIHGLENGDYTLRVNGLVVARASAADWAKGVKITAGPEYEQVEELRQTIRLKNTLFFHRWRPQNETYLFGFRKHEQGQNAVEIPRFDPLVAEQEKMIIQLSQPRARRYELRREANP